VSTSPAAGTDAPGTDESVRARAPELDGADGPPGGRSVALRLATVVALLAADLWSKSAVFAWLGSQPGILVRDSHGHPRYEIAGDWLAFMLVWNPGMAWGFDKLPPWLLVGGRCAAVVFLLWLVIRTPAARRALTVALVLILAGAAGNLYDNLFEPPRVEGATFGEVRDFIDVYFPWWDYHFPTFNIADACISVGAAVLILTSFVAPSRPAPQADASGRTA
jgi:signal peptidase II